MKTLLVTVLNGQHSGYRRAKLALANGKNEGLEVSQEQFDQLDADPNLAVTIEKELDGSGNGLSNGNDNVLATLECIRLLAQEGELTKQPAVKDVAFEVDGKKYTPTGAERDEAWAMFQAEQQGE